MDQPLLIDPGQFLIQYQDVQLKDRRHVKFSKPPSDLSLPMPLIEWGHMVNQLNQDPQADSIANSGHGMAVMEEGGADVVGDEEVEVRDKRATAEAAVDAEADNLAWDCQDPLFEFSDENCSCFNVCDNAS